MANMFSTILASFGHDVKNVLASVLESVQWLHEDIKNLSPEQNNEFNKSLALLNNINSELMQVLSIYKFENNQYSPIMHESNLEEFLDLQAAFLEPLLANNVTLDIDCADDLTWQIDEIMLSSAVRNAAMNSLKVAKSKICLRARQDADYLLIEVEDDGPGFPDKLLGQVDNYVGAVDFNSGSTGLGLYFSEQVAKLHKKGDKQGSVELRNNVGALGGACYMLRIP